MCVCCHIFPCNAVGPSFDADQFCEYSLSASPVPSPVAYNYIFPVPGAIVPFVCSQKLMNLLDGNGGTTGKMLQCATLLCGSNQCFSLYSLP